MNTIITSVDQASGNFQTKFSYKLNASLSGITGNENNYKIKFFVPDFLEISLDKINEPIKNISEEIVENGKNIILDLGTITDLGVSFSYGFAANFKLSSNGSNYINKTTLFINEQEELTYESEEIFLILNPNFYITRTRVLPLIEPAAGGSIYYKLTLENNKDIGSYINNLNINIPSTEGLIFDLSYPVIGFDKSDSGYEDKSKDNTVGIIKDNTLNFNIESYHGQRYEFIYKCNISNDFNIGNTITTFAYLNSSDKQEFVNEDTITLSENIKNANISLYAPKYSLNNKYINYELSLTNSGNALIENAKLTHTLPNEITYYKFKTGTFIYSNILEKTNFEYTINYTTILNNEGTFGTFNSDSNSEVDLNFILNNNDNIQTITYSIPKFYVGVKTNVLPSIDGIVKNTVELDKNVITSLKFNSLEVNKLVDKTTIISDINSITPVISSTKKNQMLIPGDDIKFTIGFNCTNSRVNNPVIAFILPNKLKYMFNESISVFKDYSLDTSSPDIPEIEIINNINNNNDSLIIYKFNYEFNQKSRLRMTFDTKVNIGAIGDLKTFFIMSSSSSKTDVGNIYSDESVLKLLKSPYEFKESSSLNNKINFYVAVKSNKKVKGELDTDFLEEPFVGRTLEGGLINYKLNLTNIGNANINKIEIVDILPHIGDTGVIITNKNRESEFNVYNLNEITANIKNSNIEIFYSKSYDPVRFGSAFNTIGKDNDWRLNPDKDLANIKSIKLINNTLLLPNETLEINIYCKAPISSPTNLTAWNSFAAEITYLDINNKPQKLLAVEPEKVGITIENNPLNKGSVNGITWFDDNKSGIFETNKEGINGIGVVLVNNEDIIKNYTFTSYDYNNKKGYFSFNNVDYDKYYLKFFNYENYDFTKLILDNLLGNKVDNNNDKTRIYEINETNKKITIYAGVINKPKISIEELLKVNKNVNKTVRNIINNQMLITMKTEELKFLK